MNLPSYEPLLEADDFGRLFGLGVRGAGVTVAVAIESLCCELPQDGQNLAPESICCPQAEQVMEESLATVPGGGHDTKGNLWLNSRLFATRRRCVNLPIHPDNAHCRVFIFGHLFAPTNKVPGEEFAITIVNLSPDNV
jgi:hypothetical protein